MSTRNDTCPACGDVQTGTHGLFACGSTTHPWGLNRTATCVAAQYLALDRRAEVLTARIAALEAYVARLEDAGDALAKAADTYGIPYHGHLPSIWNQAKEAKP